MLQCIIGSSISQVRYFLIDFMTRYIKREVIFHTLIIWIPTKGHHNEQGDKSTENILCSYTPTPPNQCTINSLDGEYSGVSTHMVNGQTHGCGGTMHCFLHSILISSEQQSLSLMLPGICLQTSQPRRFSGCFLFVKTFRNRAMNSLTIHLNGPDWRKRKQFQIRPVTFLPAIKIVAFLLWYLIALSNIKSPCFIHSVSGARSFPKSMQLVYMNLPLLLYFSQTTSTTWSYCRGRGNSRSLGLMAISLSGAATSLFASSNAMCIRQRPRHHV